ncbi:NADPH-dependent FMN reductase [Actinoplanes sp. TFC3]|uniref:NADPH-dependent FMN reductase n=1 Tax=Actinoplanes sp. TFC3 TaxID=1710355 RepID=UPI00082C4B04|nr:NAD(P)H-dependent oxidoreductase [Actinoplanes sp. TFC3]
MAILQVIVASTRPGRIGLPIATWFARAAAEHGGFDVELVDLADYNLPLFDEPSHPRLRQYTKEHTRRWSETIERGDAYVVVHPEYNYSFNAAIKNAFDFLHQEWADKPVSFVSYGGVSAGTRATQALKQVVTTLRMVPTFEQVPIPFAPQFLNEEGDFVPNELVAAGVGPVVNELARLNGALSSLRKSR